ncbi:MAG: glycosyltransferase family 2 protein [Nitrososphaerota archaeon]|nr:glycosyltransferase family 2 protein [Nitrososphaerota archaeon]
MDLRKEPIAGDMRARFSVGILTCNSGKTLRKCLKSVLSQGYARSSLDIFLVDAGSRDETQRIAEEFGVLIYSEIGCTRGRGRNICIERAKEEILVMLDSDIVIPPGWLAKVEVHFRDPELSEVASPYFTPEPATGMLRKIIYHLTSGWEVHVKGVGRIEDWVSE